FLPSSTLFRSTARVVVVEELAQAVHILHGLHAPYADIVGAVVHAVGVGPHTRRVIESVLYVLRTLVHDLVARDDGNGLRGFAQRRVRFRAGGAAPHHVPGHRTRGGVLGADHLHRR